MDIDLYASLGRLLFCRYSKQSPRKSSSLGIEWVMFMKPLSRYETWAVSLTAVE